MPSFGDNLKHERESRNTALEEIAVTTKIQLSYLEALEHNEFDALPGRNFGKLYIRAYAEFLGVDPQPLIADYDREQHRRKRREPLLGPPKEAARSRRTRFVPNEPADGDRRAGDTVEVGEPVESRPGESVEAELDEPVEVEIEEPVESRPVELIEAEVEEPVESRAEEAGPFQVGLEATNPTLRPPFGPRRFALFALLLSIGLVAALGWIGFRFLRTDGAAGDSPAGAEPVQTLSREGAAETARPTSPPASRTEPGETERAAAARKSEPVVPSPTPSRLTVSESGVGNRVVNRRLVDRAERFEEGDVAWFSTRVLGGSRGDSIRHVWLREGKPVHSIELELGGPHWRTHSSKTLWGVGRWSAEARDARGRVLASTRFTCVPAGS